MHYLVKDLCLWSWLNFDNDIGYRTEEEFAQWREMDPFEHILKLVNFKEKDVLEMRTEILGEIDDAVMFAKNSPFPVSL